MRKVLAGGWVEHHGRFYDFDRMRMDPAAEPSVPIHIGGHSNAGLRRALLRGDGWIGAPVSYTHLAAIALYRLSMRKLE